MAGDLELTDQTRQLIIVFSGLIAGGHSDSVSSSLMALCVCDSLELVSVETVASILLFSIFNPETPKSLTHRLTALPFSCSFVAEAEMLFFRSWCLECV